VDARAKSLRVRASAVALIVCSERQDDQRLALLEEVPARLLARETLKQRERGARAPSEQRPRLRHAR
jgi:hypothetical protein